MRFRVCVTDTVTGETSTEDLVVPVVTGALTLGQQFASAMTANDEMGTPYELLQWVENRVCRELMNAAFILRADNMLVAGLAWVTHHE